MKTDLVLDDASGKFGDATGNDSTDISTWTIASANKRPKIAISVRFSVASATANVNFVRGKLSSSGAFVPEGYLKTVATAGSRFVDEDSNFFSDDIICEMNGSTHFTILIDTISSGNVSIYVSRQ